MLFNITNDWIYRQSGVIPFRRTSDGVEVLLITSRKKKRWIIPKGIVEPELTAASSAVKEAFEEAGIRGNVSEQAIGRYDYDKWHGTCHVQVFLLEVTEILDDWPESWFRDRRWMMVREASELVREPDLRKIFQDLTSYLP